MVTSGRCVIRGYVLPAISIGVRAAAASRAMSGVGHAGRVERLSLRAVLARLSPDVKRWIFLLPIGTVIMLAGAAVLSFSLITNHDEPYGQRQDRNDLGAALVE